VVCVLWSGASRYHQENELGAIDTDDLDGVARLLVVAAESDHIVAGRELGRCCRPVGKVVCHVIDLAQSYREHRQQIWKFDRKVVTVRPPRSVDTAGTGSLGLQT